MEILSEAEAALVDARRIPKAAWFTKQQAADRLGVSTRTIQNLVASGKLRALKRAEPGGSARVVLDPDDVNREVWARLQAESLAPVHAPADLEPSPPRPPLVRMEAVAPVAELALNVGLLDASRLSGLPRGLLLRCIRHGELHAWRYRGEWFVNREDLANLRPERAPDGGE